MKVAAFYRFLDLENPEAFRRNLKAVCEQQHLLGTVLVAHEGFNGTLAGEEPDILHVLEWIESTLAIDEPLAPRWTDASEPPFRRLRVKVKKEIVTLGREGLRPHDATGQYVDPADWNALISRDDVLLIDTRNHYEVEVGTFPKAVDPGTDSFREFVAFAESLAESEKKRPLAMFCTGGIRCEKATALMMELGFDEVYHLKGGVLEYLRQVPADENQWQGECFVFDTRVAVDRDLAEGGYVQCHACRRPLSTEDLASADYVEGVSCPKCIDSLDEERAERLAERRRQVALADQRGEMHIGRKDEQA